MRRRAARAAREQGRDQRAEAVEGAQLLVALDPAAQLLQPAVDVVLEPRQVEQRDETDELRLQLVEPRPPVAQPGRGQELLPRFVDAGIDALQQRARLELVDLGEDVVERLVGGRQRRRRVDAGHRRLGLVERLPDRREVDLRGGRADGGGKFGEQRLERGREMLRIVLARGGEQRVHLGLDVGDRRLQVRAQREGPVVADLQHALEFEPERVEVGLLDRPRDRHDLLLHGVGQQRERHLHDHVRGDVDRPGGGVEVRRHIGLGDGGREAVDPVGDLAGDLVEVQSVDELGGIGEHGFDRRW